ncbi:transcription elongation factor GreA [Levilactobacillus brevis]|uniref:Transcription elongation factor GreA n=1 Tax=Levilactobacillus brevis ATCC 14869 = DSM 20054 TaxID=649758 RepID=U2R1C6_LEVBR|nr:transcription elongation factor GreA [Levilactobacillus brevis]ERK44452.1 transcription elongation factor GreA [Levilactobacillus brevis ATCC 14869 = DSM 20054]KIO98636.1 Transcription elongation factor GreA [Levilactobacillus brevis]KRK20063.1 transcription elongation factor GreA [Levilactobacillus brevis ATCC 14869 = DSM 20054]MCT3572331.1 transcription elongation factor GreA [Levilactobacillus brevis]SQG74680.1 transcription elongation factor GreA [Levilactobacillus brevis]
MPSSHDFNPITAAGYQDLQSKIAALEADRPEKIAILAEARAHGDLSENAEYSAAKRDLRHLESQLRFYTKQLQYAKVVAPSDSAVVELGKWVTVTFLDDHEQATYQLVGTQEADLAAGKITRVSPLGKALLGHQPGDTVTILAPHASYQVQINQVQLTLK